MARSIKDLEKLSGLETNKPESLDEGKMDMDRAYKALAHNMKTNNMKMVSKMAKDILKTNGQEDFDKYIDMMGQLTRK